MKRTKYRILYYNILVSAFALVIINLLDLKEAYELMLLYSLNAATVFGLLVYEEIKLFRGLNMNLLILVGFCMRLVLPSITKAWGAINGESYAYLIPENDVTDYMFPTIVWMNIYYSIFLCCLFRFESKYTLEAVIAPFFNKFKVLALTIPLFIVGIVYNIITSYIPVGFIPGIINSFLGNMATLAVITQLFAAIYEPTKINKSFFNVCIIVGIYQAMFFGFYKSAIMMYFVFYLLYYFLRRKYENKSVFTSKFIVSILLLFITIDLVIYPFMSTKRIVSGWDVTSGGLATQQYSNLDILADVISGRLKQDENENTATGRLDAIEPNAFFYKECVKRGLRTTELVMNQMELLVPRFINPNKHNSQAGLMVYAYATTGTFKNHDTAVSNNYIGQFGSAYLIGGSIMVILLAFFNGWFIAFYYNFLLKHRNHILSLFFLLPLIMESLLGFEEVHDGGLFRAAYDTIMMIGILGLSTFFPRFLTIRTK